MYTTSKYNVERVSSNVLGRVQKGDRELVESGGLIFNQKLDSLLVSHSAMEIPTKMTAVISTEANSRLSVDWYFRCLLDTRHRVPAGGKYRAAWDNRRRPANSSTVCCR